MRDVPSSVIQYICKTQRQTCTAKATAKEHEKIDVWIGCLPVN